MKLVYNSDLLLECWRQSSKIELICRKLDLSAGLLFEILSLDRNTRIIDLDFKIAFVPYSLDDYTVGVSKRPLAVPKLNMSLL